MLPCLCSFRSVLLGLCLADTDNLSPPSVLPFLAERGQFHCLLCPCLATFDLLFLLSSSTCIEHETVIHPQDLGRVVTLFFFKSCQINSLDNSIVVKLSFVFVFVQTSVRGSRVCLWLIVLCQRPTTGLLVQFSHLWNCHPLFSGEGVRRLHTQSAFYFWSCFVCHC